MARERYLLNDDEVDTLHSNIITPKTKKEKWSNWWYYNTRKVILLTFVAIVVSIAVCSIVCQVQPDYTIGIISHQYLSEDNLYQLENHLEKYAEDVNGDGQVYVMITNNYLGSSAEGANVDPSLVQAGIVRFAADLTSAHSMIWLSDEKGFYQFGEDDEPTRMLQNVYDGETPLAIPMQEVEGFKDLEFTSSEDGWSSEDYTNYLTSKLSLSIRQADQFPSNIREDANERLTDAQSFFDRIISDTKINE